MSNKQEEFDLSAFKVGVRVKSFDKEYRQLNGKWKPGYHRGTITQVAGDYVKVKWGKGPVWDLRELVHSMWELVDGVVKLDDDPTSETLPTSTQDLFDEMSILNDDVQRWKFLMENSGNPNLPSLWIDNDDTYVDWEKLGTITFDNFIGNDEGVGSLLDAAGIKWDNV